MDTIYCLDSAPTFFGFLDPSIAPTLLYYAYIPVLAVSLIVGTLIYARRADFHLPHKLFFFITLLFSFYILNEILQWIAVPAGLVQFGWQMIAVYFTSLTLLLVYFVLTLLRKKDIYSYEKIGLSLLALPTFVLLPTTLNMGAMDLWWCQSTTGELYFYIYSLALLSAIYIVSVGIYLHIKNRSKIALPLTFGSAVFITLLTGADLYSEFTDEFEFNLIGPIGMVLFLVAISYLTVRFSLFNFKLMAAQALVGGLIVLIGSQLFFVDSAINFILVSVTLTLSSLGGYLLIQSVKHEVKQRQEIEELATKLSKANKRLRELDKLKSEFVSIASHQLRSPLTAIRGYASMLLEGSYGALSKKATDAVERIAESSGTMAASVEDYLNVSRIESGNMKYELIDFNLKDEASKVVDDKRQEAMKSGLLLTFASQVTGHGVVNADIGKVRQILHNLINNAIKYTPKGSIKVLVSDDKKAKKVRVAIEDTGIGMKQDELESIFEKFQRAHNANDINVTGTGLGLFVAQKMATEMGGKITVRSDGPEQGSTFTLELPLQM